MGDVKRYGGDGAPPEKHMGRWSTNRLFNHILHMLTLMKQYDEGKIAEAYQMTYDHDLAEVVDVATHYIGECVTKYQIPNGDVGLNTLIALRDALTVQQLSVQPAVDLKLWTYLKRLPSSPRFILHQHGNAGDARIAAMDAAKRYVSEESNKHVTDMSTYQALRPSEFSNDVAKRTPQ